MYVIARYLCSVFVCDQLPALVVKAMPKRFQKFASLLTLVAVVFLATVYFKPDFETNFYKEFGIKRNFAENDLKKAYRNKSIVYHPDKKGGSVALFEKYQKMYDILRNPLHREIYDKEGNKTAELFRANTKNYTEVHATQIMDRTLVIDCVGYVSQIVMMRFLSRSEQLLPARKFYQLVLIVFLGMEIHMMVPRELQPHFLDEWFPQMSLHQRMLLFKIAAAIICLAVKLRFLTKGTKKSDRIVQSLEQCESELAELAEATGKNKSIKFAELKNSLEKVEKGTSKLSEICSAGEVKEKREKTQKLKKCLMIIVVILVVLIVLIVAFERMVEITVVTEDAQQNQQEWQQYQREYHHQQRYQQQQQHYY